MGLSGGAASALIHLILNHETTGDIISAIIAGVSFDVLFPVALILLSKNNEARANHLRKWLAQSHRIACDGHANLQNTAGWMFLCEDALVFYPNNGGNPLPIPRSDIRSAHVEKNRLVICTDANEFRFHVNKANLWLASILQTSD